MILNSRKAWEAYFRDVGLREDLIEQHGAYAGRLLDAGLPVIFEWHHLAALLGVSTEYVASVVSAGEYHYRRFSIPKRNGGIRVIEAPRAVLKNCQRWVLKNILQKIDISSSAKGFVKRRSIKSHAQVHVGAQRILKLDFDEFFPSISKGRVISIFRSIGYSESVSLYLASLCCLRERLPQGAPTSPALSNIVCRRFDLRIAKLCRKANWRYSRYADDLAISGGNIGIGALSIVRMIANEEGFKIKEEKTRLYAGGGRRVLTGVCIGAENLSVPRSFKREVTQQVYYVAKFGLLSHVAKTRRREPLLLDSLKGKLEFWLFIEPTSAKAMALKQALLRVPRVG